MINQDLKAFSEEVKKGFVEALGDKSSFSYQGEDFVTGFFTDYLTGEECATVKRNGEEICITADEAYDILADQSKRQSVEQYWDCY